MKTLIKKAGTTLVLGTAFFATSCIGPNNAFEQVHSRNSRLSDSKFINELAFLGLNIVPVYSICMFGDLLIFNSVEFWTGSNWINKPEAFKPQETAK